MNQATIDLSAIMVGAQVAWLTWGGAHGPEPYVGTVSRLTPTQIVITSDRGFTYRFRRTNGRGIGGSLWGVYLRSPSDPEVIRARAGLRFRNALHEIASLAEGINGKKDPVHARTQLGRIRQLAKQALLDLTLI